MGERGADDAADGKDERRIGVGILTDEGKPALAVRMRRYEAKLELRQLAQQRRPYEVPPQAAQEQEPENRTADKEAPPAGKGQAASVRQGRDEPRRGVGGTSDIDQRQDRRHSGKREA